MARRAWESTKPRDSQKAFPAKAASEREDCV
jgi:hypothetical protein